MNVFSALMAIFMIVITQIRKPVIYVSSSPSIIIAHLIVYCLGGRLAKCDRPHQAAGNHVLPVVT
jgi:hypothetical protein